MANTNHSELRQTNRNGRLRDDKLRSSNPQLLRSSAISNGREKLDSTKPFSYGDRRGVGNSAEFQALREREALAPPETKFDVRKSLAWDSAFFTSPGVLDPEELVGTVNVFGPREHVYLSSDESFEGNSRTSLAWDSAFLTDAGVLDPDELCIVNKGFNKSGTHRLSGLKELQRSVDSNSTIDNDCFSLESLEFELFDVVRMSQQNGIASNAPSSKCRRGTASKKLDVSSRRRTTRPTSDSSKQCSNKHEPERIRKEASGLPRGLRLQQTARSVELNPSALRPPKIVRRATSIPAAPNKRAALGAKHAQLEDNYTKDAPGHVIASKKQCLRNSNNVLSIPKTPRLGSSTPRKENVACSVKSPTSSQRRITHSRDVANGSTLSSLPTSPSSISLASSIDSTIDVWSFESTPPTQTSDIVGLPQLKASLDLTDIARKSRPSGLRKPSPKLGFFDGMSSLSPTGVLQYQWDVKGTPLRDADILKHTKLPTIRTSIGPVNTKTGVLSPLSVRTRNLNHFQGENTSSNISTGQGILGARKVGTAETNLNVKTRGNERVMNKVQREDKGQVCGRSKKQSVKRHAQNGHSHLREKENVFSFEDHVNSLSNQIRGFDLGAM